MVSWQITLHFSSKFWLLDNWSRRQNTKKLLEIEYTNVIKLKCPLNPFYTFYFKDTNERNKLRRKCQKIWLISIMPLIKDLLKKFFFILHHSSFNLLNINLERLWRSLANDWILSWYQQKVFVLFCFLIKCSSPMQLILLAISTNPLLGGYILVIFLKSVSTTTKKSLPFLKPSTLEQWGPR